MWLDKYETSEWAFRYCKYIKDRPEVRKLITDSYWAYHYCRFIKDRLEVRKYITNSQDIYNYRKHIKNRLLGLENILRRYNVVR